MMCVARFTVVLVVLASNVAIAKSTEMNFEALEVKARLEKTISERLRSSLATVLEDSAFQVSAEVTVEGVKAEPPQQSLKKPQALQVDPPPGDMTLGIVDAEPIIRYYQDRIQQFQSQADEKGMRTESAVTYVVKSVRLNVGLSDQLGSDYSKTMAGWLKKWAFSNFGANVATSVTSIKPKPVDKSKDGEKDKEKSAAKTGEEPRSLLKNISDIQHLLGLAFLGVCLIAGLVLWRVLAPKPVSAPSVANERFAPPLPEPVNEKEDKIDVTAQTSELSVTVMKDLKDIRDFTSKIAGLAQDLGGVQNHLVSIWIDNGKRGQFKLACFLDAAMHEHGDNQFSLVNLAPDIKEGLVAVFTQMAALSPSSKVKLLKEVYWDMMACRVLGIETLKVPFGYLGNLSDKPLKDVISGQTTEVQALVVLNMPENVRERYFKDLDSISKKSLLRQSLDMSGFQASDLEMVNQTIRTMSEKQRTVERTIAAGPLARRLLESLPTREEVEILPEVCGSLRDKGRSIMRSYPSLAFLESWPREKVSLLCADAESNELLALAQSLPSAQNLILDCAPTRVAEIIRDDMNRVKLKTEEKDKYLDALKQRMNQLIAQGQINLDEIFPDVIDDAGQASTAA